MAALFVCAAELKAWRCNSWRLPWSTSFAGRAITSRVTSAAIFALMLTAIYCTGIITRRGTVVARMGLDSWAVLIVYTLGMWAILAGVFAR